MAERKGFEPLVPAKESLVFKTSSLNRSDTSPCRPVSRDARSGMPAKQVI